MAPRVQTSLSSCAGTVILGLINVRGVTCSRGKCCFRRLLSSERMEPREGKMVIPGSLSFIFSEGLLRSALASPPKSVHTDTCTHTHTHTTVVSLEPALGVRAGTPRGIHLWDGAGARGPGQKGEPWPDLEKSVSSKQPPPQRSTNSLALILFS